MQRLRSNYSNSYEILIVAKCDITATSAWLPHAITLVALAHVTYWDFAVFTTRGSGVESIWIHQCKEP